MQKTKKKIFYKECIKLITINIFDTINKKKQLIKIISEIKTNSIIKL